MNMLSRALKAPLGAKSALKLAARTAWSARTHSYATTAQPATTSGLGERATFTIRGGPTFTGKSFGARQSVSGEAVFSMCIHSMDFKGSLQN
jgi:hypothetical protein